MRFISSNYFVLTIFIIYVLLFIIVNFSKNKKVVHIVTIIQERGNINSLLTNVFLISLITLFVAGQSNQVAQKQIEIENRESAPSINLDHVDQNYVVKNSKGIASYVNFCSYEQYNFIYNGEAYEIKLGTFYEESNNKMHLDNDCHKLCFKPSNDTFDRDLAFNLICNYIQKKTNTNIIPASTKVLELNFYDHQNKYCIFEYNEYDKKINLSNTDTIYAPDNNITVSIWDKDTLEQKIEYAVDYLL